MTIHHLSVGTTGNPRQQQMTKKQTAGEQQHGKESSCQQQRSPWFRRILFVAPWLLLLRLQFKEAISMPSQFGSMMVWNNEQQEATTRAVKKDPSTRKLTLDELTRPGENITCPPGTQFVGDIVVGAKLDNNNFKIPRVIHQSSKSRCLTPQLSSAVNQWKQFENYEYRFHDDAAVARLIEQGSAYFPHLQDVVSCIHSATAKGDIWRLLLLWEYGGIYTDIDTEPRRFNATTIATDDQAFFVVEQLGIVSQYFIASSPRHPFLYYCISRALLNVVVRPDTKQLNAAIVTGPRAIREAFELYMSDPGARVPNETKSLEVPKGYCYEGFWVGTHNRTMRIVGTKEDSNEWVMREAVRRGNKVEEYKMMNMTHFLSEVQEKSNISCLRHIMESHSIHDIVHTRRRLLL